jgi:hypothetical protein
MQRLSERTDLKSSSGSSVWYGTFVRTLWIISLVLALGPGMAAQAASVRSQQFEATTSKEAIRWQRESREKLFALLIGGARPKGGPLQPEILRRLTVPAGGYVLEELTLQTLPDRRAHVWLAAPTRSSGKVGAVLALHGHGGTGEEMVRGLSLYWYGRAMAEMGYVIISPDIGQHELQHANWTLMGERVWDALRCLDYLETRPGGGFKPHRRGGAVPGRRDDHVCGRARRTREGGLQQRLADDRGEYEERPLPLLQLSWSRRAF